MQDAQAEEGKGVRKVTISQRLQGRTPVVRAPIPFRDLLDVTFSWVAENMRLDVYIGVVIS